MRTIYLGAGCFWCVEAVFKRLKGVVTVASGYMGGHIKNPSYREVCTGTTGHAEVVKIEYDEQVIDLNKILEVFWTSHDPTTLNRQGADKGTQYRSAIFYTDDEQKNIAIHSKDTVPPLFWNDAVVTEIAAATDYYEAENEHQNYYDLHPDQMYCAYTIPPKLKKLEQNFPHLLK